MSNSIEVLGIVELDSVAQGYHVLDRMVKAAPVQVMKVAVVNPGKFLIVITGEVAEVEESMKRGIAAAGESLLDYLFLPNLHEDVMPALHARGGSESAGLAGGSTVAPARGDVADARGDIGELDALGVIEAFSTTAGIEAADTAAKEAAVRIIEIRTGDELGGKSTATLMGPISEIEAAVAVAGELLSEKQLLVRTTIIARPHDDLAPYVTGSGSS